MYTKNDLINDLKKMGLKPSDTIFVHSSYKKIAGDTGVEGGADTIVDAFIEYFGEKGLVVFPSMSWKLGYYFNDQGDLRHPSLGGATGYSMVYGNHFDVRETPCHDLGIIPEIFRKREGVLRSLCPSSSMTAFGPEAEDFLRGHENSPTAFDWNYTWGNLYRKNAKTLFLGTTMRCNTFMHVIEEYADVPGIVPPYVWKYTVTDYQGNTFPVNIRRNAPNHNRYYHKVTDELIKNGIVSTSKASCSGIG